MGYSRLDDRYIEDDIFRALFHQEMIKRVSSITLIISSTR
ncbi:hypothetical protein ECDEC9E_3576 [Escherichia coli DEC9E]|nr:hypothetical protein ECDEC9E_3576 [Escherichia coli DEC9E]